MQDSKSRYFKLLTLLAIVFTLSACGGSSNEPASAADDDTTAGAGGGSGGGSAGSGTTGCPVGLDEPAAGMGVVHVRDLASPLSPIMRSGFESGTVGEPSPAITHFSGVDSCSEAPNDWANLLATNPNRPGGYFLIQYQGGDINQRFARLGADSSDADNQVLEFWLNDANVDTGYEFRGRIQGNFYENYNLDSYYQSVRLRLGRDFLNLNAHNGTFNWLTLFEAWNGANWIAGEEHAFHIAVDLTKPDPVPGTALHLKAQGRTFTQGVGFDTLWEETNSDIVIPVEQWITLELYMLQGDEQSGRFYMTVSVAGGEKQVLFDIGGFTHHPEDIAPAGFDYINPIKLYMREPVLDIMKATGGSFRLQWDDLEFGHTAN